MANVVNNPDFSLLDPFATYVLGWTRASWEPKLCVGGQHGAISGDIQHVPGRGGRYYVGAEGRVNPLVGIPGVLYSGPGFDANPGDVWAITFDYQWAAYDLEWQNNLPAYGGSANREIFIRYGVTLWNPATSHWDMFVGELPHWPVPMNRTALGLPETLSDAIHNDGPLITYTETFTVPANFPTCRLQFAICHTPHAYDQVDWENPSFGSPRGYGYRMYVNTFDLDRVSVGSPGGSGSSPDDSGYVFWPTPRFAPGTPSGFNVNLEWDQFQLDPVFPPQAAGTLSAHRGLLATDPGMVGVHILVRTPTFLASPGVAAFELLYPGVVWLEYASSNFGLPPAGAVPYDLPDTSTTPWPNFPQIFTYVSDECGPHQSRVSGVLYLLVGEQEVASKNLFGGTVYATLAPGVMLWLHPYSRPTHDFQQEYLELNLPYPDPQEFDYTLPCSADVYVWEQKHNLG